MCIYCGTPKYRKIYENHFGSIPKDSNGRSYEIHHIDGDRENNHPNNLTALSIQDHYNIHEEQGDWAACLKIGSKMQVSPEELSRVASLNAKKRLAEGSHPFSGSNNPVHKQLEDGTHPFLNGARSRATQNRLVATGQHHLQSGKIQTRTNKKRIEAGTHNFLGSNLNRKRIEDGSHHCLTRTDGTSLTSDRVLKGMHQWLGPECNKKRIEAGTHNFLGPSAPSQIEWHCPHCGTHGKGKGNYTRAHGNNCKNKTTKINTQ